jgi:hypothetical protein
MARRRIDPQAMRRLLVIAASMWGFVLVVAALWTLLAGWGFWQRFGYAAVIVGCLTLLGSGGVLSWATRARAASATGRMATDERVPEEPALGLTGTGVGLLIGLPMALLGGMIVS